MKAIMVCFSRNIFLPALLIFCLSSTHVYGNKVFACNFTLAKPTCPERIFTAKVKPGRIAYLSFTKMGLIEQVLPAGSEFSAHILDINGKIIDEGTILAKQDTTICEYNLKIAQDKVEASKTLLYTCKLEYARCKKLYSENVISRKAYDAAYKNFSEAQADLLEKMEELRINQYKLDSCYLYSPFSGEVVDVMATIGDVKDSGKSILKVQDLSFIKLKVNLNQDLTRMLDPTSIIEVYSRTDVANKLGVYLSSNNIKTDYIILYVINHKVPTFIPTKEENQLPKIYNPLLALRYKDGLDNPLWIPSASIKKDKNGYFVWKAKGQKVFAPDKTIKRTFEIEKIPVKLSATKSIRILGECYLLNNTGLKPHDVILTDAPDNIKNGERVLYQTTKWAFRPDEEVFVKIPDFIDEKGYFFYSPAVFKDSNGQHYVYKAVSGKAQKINVEVLKDNGYYCIIDNNSLKPGDKLLIPEEKEKLHEGSEIIPTENMLNSFGPEAK